MVDTQVIARGIHDERVIEAMSRIPRHLFVEDALYHQAYNDYPLPIGNKQTISQPYIVAFMTQSLNLTGDEKVLEIGTGSGYQAAVLAEIVNEVFTIEIRERLKKRASGLQQELGYKNVKTKYADSIFL